MAFFFSPRIDCIFYLRTPPGPQSRRFFSCIILQQLCSSLLSVSEMWSDVQSVRGSSSTRASGSVPAVSGDWTDIPSSPCVTCARWHGAFTFQMHEGHLDPLSSLPNVIVLVSDGVMVCISFIKYGIKLIRKMRINLSPRFLYFLMLLLFLLMLQGFFKIHTL